MWFRLLILFHPSRRNLVGQAKPENCYTKTVHAPRHVWYRWWQVKVTEDLFSLIVIKYCELKRPSRSSNFGFDECVIGEWNIQHFLSDKNEWLGILLSNRPSYIIHNIHVYKCTCNLLISTSYISFLSFRSVIRSLTKRMSIIECVIECHTNRIW